MSDFLPWSSHFSSKKQRKAKFSLLFTYLFVTLPAKWKKRH